MRVLSVLPMLGSLAIASACPPSAEDCAPVPAASTDEEVQDEDVVYGGLGNDEVWLTLYDAKGRAETGDKAARVIVPAADQVLPSDTPPTFEWESDLSLALGPQLPTPLSPGRERSPLDVLSHLLIPNAYAHLPPVTSDAYLLEIAIPGRTCPRSIVTTGLLHTLDDETWAALTTALGQDLTLTIWSAYLSTGVPTEGPYVSEPVTFRVE